MKPVLPWLFPSVVVALGIYVAWRNYPWWERRDEDAAFQKWYLFALGILATALLSITAWVMGYGLSSWLGHKAESEYRVYWKAKMASLRSADGITGKISGGIFMLSGYVDSQQTYFYYTEATDGYFEPHRWEPGETTRIYEEDRSDGQVIQWDKHFKKDWLEWFAELPDDFAMDFHIPKGSLKQAFSLQ